MNYQNKYDLPDELVSLVDRELDSDEHVEWVGQPIAGRLARSSLPIVVFGIPWTAFAVFWTVMASGITTRKGGGEWSWVFALWGVPFILIGLGMLTSPYWMQRRAKRTAYVLTDRRAIVLSLGWRSSASVRSFQPGALTDLQRKERADGSGDLVFTNDLSSASRGRSMSTAVGFLAIPNVKEVEARVRRLAQESHNAQVS